MFCLKELRVRRMLQKKPGDYYLYLCELLHEEICWKRGRYVMI